MTTLTRTLNEGWLMVKSSKEYPLVKGSRFADYVTLGCMAVLSDGRTLSTNILKKVKTPAIASRLQPLVKSLICSGFPYIPFEKIGCKLP